MTDFTPIHEEPDEPEMLDDPDAAPAKPRSRASLAKTGARILTGIIGLGVAAACVAAATWLPLASIAPSPKDVLVTPTAAVQHRTCFGPVLRLGNALGQDATTPYSIGAPSVTMAGSGQQPTRTTLEVLSGQQTVRPVHLELAGDENTLLAASQTQRVDDGELLGLTAASCGIPTSESWLVGGDTDTGRTTLLTLSNPHPVISTVDITIWGENGLITATGASGLVVPPGSQRVLSLAGFAPDVTSPVVRVVSRGGQVVANLEHSVVRTLEPGGIDLLGAGAGPALQTVIPGLTIQNHAGIESMLELGTSDDLHPALRILVPGEEPTTARISFFDEEQQLVTADLEIDLPAGRVTELPLEFPDAVYTVTIETDAPIVAAARSSTVAPGPDEDTPAEGLPDLGWYVSAPLLTTSTLVAVAPGPSPVLHLVARSGAQTVTLTDQDAGGGAGGDERAGGENSGPVVIELAAGAAVAVPVEGGARYLIEGMSGISAAVTYTEDAGLAAFVLHPPSGLSEPVRVYR